MQSPLLEERKVNPRTHPGLFRLPRQREGAREAAAIVGELRISSYVKDFFQVSPNFISELRFLIDSISIHSKCTSPCHVLTFFAPSHFSQKAP